MQRQINSFPIPFHLRYKLFTAGFHTDHDIKGSDVTAKDLASACSVTADEAELIFSIISSTSEQEETQNSSLFSKCPSALEILTNEDNTSKIATFCRSLDNLLDGGIPLNRITEICGIPGTGKTQLCLQLCASVHIPEVFGGVAGEAIFIDAEGSFVAKRMKEIADATVRHCFHMAKQDKEYQEVVQDYSTERILQQIHYYPCDDYLQLLAILYLLQERLKEGRVKLIVIDSIDFHFRLGFNDCLNYKFQVLDNIACQLRKFAEEYNLAVVVTNHMVSKFDDAKNVTLIPALGKSWAHACSLRITLCWQSMKHNRRAFLSKCPYGKEGHAEFQITNGGIRDVIHQRSSTNGNSLASVNPNNKRPNPDTE